MPEDKDYSSATLIGDRTLRRLLVLDPGLSGAAGIVDEILSPLNCRVEVQIQRGATTTVFWAG